MSLIDKLENEIIAYLASNTSKPSVIICNPITWADMVREVGVIVIHRQMRTGAKSYKGNRIIRSYDVAPGEFEIY